MAAFDGSFSATLHLLSEGYRAAPAFMIVLVAVVMLPALSLAVSISRWAERAAQRPIVVLRRSQPHDDRQQPHFGTSAFVEIFGVGNRSSRTLPVGDMLRIGREEDNDVRIPSPKVQSYHAAIVRQDSGGYALADLSRRDGTGVLINGLRCGEARLADGDVIDFGAGKVVFHM